MTTGSPIFTGCRFPLKRIKPFDPSKIRFFGSSTAVKSLNFLTNEIKKPRFSLFWLINIVHFIPVILIEIIY